MNALFGSMTELLEVILLSVFWMVVFSTHVFRGLIRVVFVFFFFFFQAEDGIRDDLVTGVQTCALPISLFRNVWL